MRTTQTLSAASLVALASACASAQITAYASGLRHRAVGATSSLDVTERRLTACCIGSSGQDGVEIQLHSQVGGGVGVDIGQLLQPSPSSREIKIRPKGWDGTIKGTLRLISNPGAPGLIETYDFSMVPGVTSLHWALYDPAGNELASGESAGPILDWTIDVPQTGTAECNKYYSFEGPPAGTAARSADEGFFDRVISVSGLTPDTITNVQSVSVTPRTCLGCPPPFVDLDSVAITGSGMPTITLNDAHLLSQGSGGSVGKPHKLWGTGAAHIEEFPIGDLDDDGLPDLRYLVSNLGSSGQDGVAIDFGSHGGGGGGGSGGATWSVSGNCCRGHVILMKAFDDENGEQARVMRGTDPASTDNTIACDFSMIGSPECLVEFRDAAGNAVYTRMLPPGEPVIYTACDDTAPFEKFVSATHPATGEVELRHHLCGDTNHFRLVDGTSPPGAVVAAFRPVTGSMHQTARAEITGSGISQFDVALVGNLPPVAPPCDPDLNQDGNVDQDDVLYLINVVGGGNNDTGIDPDFNQDGNVDQDDVTALINTVGGGGCP
ncbi:MAG: hypothetical protein IT433_10265 [Phycisphaerales bacterium]|nr:hypothetical protein [Phycisphaerales bacterium]